MNGAVRLYFSGSITNLAASTNFVSLPQTFPIVGKDAAPEGEAETPPARFDRLKIERTAP